MEHTFVKYAEYKFLLSFLLWKFINILTIFENYLRFQIISRDIQALIISLPGSIRAIGFIDFWTSCSATGNFEFTCYIIRILCTNIFNERMWTTAEATTWLMQLNLYIWEIFLYEFRKFNLESFPGNTLVCILLNWTKITFLSNMLIEFTLNKKANKRLR